MESDLKIGFVYCRTTPTDQEIKAINKYFGGCIIEYYVPSPDCEVCLNHFEELPKVHQEEEDPHLEVPIFQAAHHSNHRVVELGQVHQVGHPMGAFPIPPCLEGEPSC